MLTGWAWAVVVGEPIGGRRYLLGGMGCSRITTALGGAAWTATLGAVLALLPVTVGCGFDREEAGPGDLGGVGPGGWGEDDSTGTDATGEDGDDAGGEETSGPEEDDPGDDTDGPGEENDTGDPGGGGDDPPEGDTGGGGPADPEVPEVTYCDGVANWQASYAAFEEELLVLVNERRAQGANCGSFGSFGPAAPLVMHPALRCAARVHSKDMAERNFFDHTNPDGEHGGHRMGKAGYNGQSGGENIASGSPTPSSVMAGWMASDGHCSNIMKPSFRDFGGGYYPGGGYGHLWTQVFGVP